MSDSFHIEDVHGVRGDKHAHLMRSFDEMIKEGYTPFLLGPVYVYAGVQGDLFERFRDEVAVAPVRTAKYVAGKLNVTNDRLDMRAMHLKFDLPIIANCPGWHNTLSILDTDSFLHFKKWLLCQQFVNREKRTFHVVRNYTSPIIDPLKLTATGKAEHTGVELFSVCGMRGSLVPKYLNLSDWSDARTYVEFVIKPPDEDVIKLGSAALKIMREI
jgi:hypothetical protein